MDINKIFDLFNQNTQIKDEDVIIANLYEHPLFWVGMFEKIVKNNAVFKTKIVKFFSTNDSEYSIEELNESGDAVVFARAYMFIKNIDLNNPEHQKAIISRDKCNLSSAISLTIDYFSTHEEYEKCAFLKKIQTFLEKDLAT
jgi:hypothetical protein